jgi:hypothetical protein
MFGGQLNGHAHENQILIAGLQIHAKDLAGRPA